MSSHGLSGTNQKGKIIIDIKEQNKLLEIKVFDNGHQFPPDLNAGYGLKNIMDKLQILYPEGYSLEFINAPEKHLLLRLNLNPSMYGDNS